MTVSALRRSWFVALILTQAALLPAASPIAVHGTGGAVASAAPGATDAGLEILAAGGNAVDAAVATALALAVVHPSAGNLGGGGFAVVKMGDTVATLDFREAAPSAARHDMYLDEKGDPVSDKSLIGPLAAGIPGSPMGLWELHHKYGSLAWGRVVTPAIRLAEEGFIVTDRLERSVEKAAEVLGRFPETSAIWLPGGAPPAAGSTLRIPDLAATLRAYAELGPKAISSGPVAAAVEAVSDRYGGVLKATDLQSYRPVWREPVFFDAFGWRCASMPLPSSGGIILAQTTGILQRIGWRDAPRFGARRAHLLAETWRLAYADRYLLGDPSSTEADADQLLAAGWLDRRTAELDPKRATPSTEVGNWSDRGVESPETTHLSTADAHGNVVSMTTTLNGSFGCGLVVDGAGFLLNNEMDDFAVAPGKPNYYGLIQGEANSVGPGKRMLSSMSPTVAWRGDEILVVGSPGGSTIPTATVQVLLNVVADDDELQSAVNRPRMHHQWMPDRIDVEPDTFSPETAARLEKLGHAIDQRDHLGEVHAVRIRADGTVEAAADPRGPGAAGVVTPLPGG